MGEWDVKATLYKIIDNEFFSTAPQYFKQFNVYNNFWLKENIMQEQIEAVFADLRLERAKVVQTLEGESVEGQHLTGLKLILIGVIGVKMVVNACERGPRNWQYKYKELPFSTYIIVPNPLCNMAEVSIGYMIEDTTVLILEENNLMISVTLLLEYQNQSLA